MKNKIGKKKLMYYIILVIIIIISGRFFIRWFENYNLYYPTSKIEYTPDDINLKYSDFEIQLKSGPTITGWIIPSESSKGFLIFCHGNGGNISHRIETIGFFNKLDITVAIFDYPGYGKSSGKPNESNLFESAGAVYKMLQDKYGMKSEECIIYGRSLGGAVAVDLASHVSTAGLIVESGFSSTIQMGKEIFPFLPAKLIISQPFDSISKIPKITAPKLIMHSRKDEIIPYHHGEDLYRAASEPKIFLEISGTHNDGYEYRGKEYAKSLKEFIDSTLPTNPQ